VAQEIELKLEIPRDGVDALIASGILGVPREETRLHAIYFDTADRELHRHGHSLRIRTEGGKAVQTVKSGDAAAGLFSRGEWELPVAGRRPVDDSRTPVSDLLAQGIDRLMPIFEVPDLRRSFDLRDGESTIDVALDQGEAQARGRSSAFCEVELELVAGQSTVLFALARRIDAVAHVRIGVLSKADRGYRLLDALPLAEKASHPVLTDDMTGAAAFAAIAASCIRQYRLNEAILLDHYAPEAVHQARIGIRRLRSAMVLFKGMLAGTERDAMNARLRDLAACLGEARDLDVLTEAVRTDPMRERLGHARGAAHAAMNRKLKAKATRMLLLDLSQWIADGAWLHDPATAPLREVRLREFADGALDKRRRTVAKHGKHLAELEPEARHRLRKDAKKLRYAAEFLAPLYAANAKRKKFFKALEALQDDLGALNDRAAAEERLAALGMAGTPEAEEFLASWQNESLLDEAAERRQALLAAKPFWK
jgi:triphosphatase